jgi:DNA-binding transcriptional ArsR family regulator
MQAVIEKNGRIYSLSAKEVPGNFAPLAKKILFMLAKKPSYPKDLAKKLGVHEQKIYYHIRCLEKQGFVKIHRKEERGAAMAKYYTLTKPSFIIRFKDFQHVEKIPKTASSFLEPFIVDEKLDAKIIVGSPDPHGPERARSRDAYYGIDLGTFLGTFLSSATPSVMLDTDMRSEDMKQNLIVIGGPVINRITKQINDKMPVRFDNKKRIFSSFTKKTYISDDNGIIVKITNPYDRNKKILVIAGRRFSGTRAAIIAFLRKFEEIEKKEARVVEGLDMDGDGIVDDVKILE